MSTTEMTRSPLADQVALAMAAEAESVRIAREVAKATHKAEQEAVEVKSNLLRVKWYRQFREILPNAAIRVADLHLTPHHLGLNTVIYVDVFKLEYMVGAHSMPHAAWYLINAKTGGVYYWERNLQNVPSQSIFIERILAAIHTCPLEQFFHNIDNRGK